MGCRILNIKPPCEYKVDGIASISVLDFEDLDRLRFNGDDLYSNCLVTGVLKSGMFAEVNVTDTAKYSSSLQNGIYTHTIETFISELSAYMSANLHLATKRRYVVFFRTNTGRYFCFGYDAGASVTYANQTTEGTGSLMTLTTNSIYPLFEVAKEAFNYNVLATEEYNVVTTEDKKGVII